MYFLNKDWVEPSPKSKKPKGFTQACQLKRNNIQPYLKTIKSINNINSGDAATMKMVLQKQAISGF